VYLDSVGGRKGIVVNPYLVPSEFGIDSIETPIEADIGKVLVHDTSDFSQKGREHLVHFHMPYDGEPCIIAILWGLVGLGVEGFMVGYVEPRTELAVEIIEPRGVLCAHLGFELILDGAKEALDEPPGGRISRGTVDETGVSAVACGLETV
jgi:hypothetical protein